MPYIRETLLLAPTRSAADDGHWSANTQGAAGVHRFSLHQLAAVTAAGPLAISGRRPAGELSTEALVARVLHQLRTDNRLGYFAPVQGTPGLARSLARTLNELRLDGITPDQLRRYGGAPGLDLALCLDLFARELERHALADLAFIYRLALDGGTSRFAGIPLVLLDLEPRHTLPRQFLEKVVRSSPTVERRTAASVAPGTALDRARRFVFAPQIPDRGQFDDSLDYFSAAGEALECVEIARRALRAASEGVPFDRMAVLLRSSDTYQPLLEEAFRRAAIPAYFSRGSQRPDPAGRAFLALLACALENCSASRFAEYLSLGQVPSGKSAESRPPSLSDEVLSALAGLPSNGGAAVDAEAEPDDESDSESSIVAGSLQSPSHWERLLIDAAVVGGADRWERRLNGWEQELKRQARHTRDDEREQARIKSERKRLGNLRAFALPLVGRLHARPQQASWADWLTYLDELATISLRKPRTVRSLLAELAPMSDIGPVGLPEVYSVLEDRLRFLRSDPPRRRFGHVFVSTIEEAQGRTFSLVFLPGLSEGQFPRKVAEDPLLLDEHRSRINSSVSHESSVTREPLRLNRERREQERLLLRIALNAGERLVFSYPRVELAESRARVPSFYALEIVRAALGSLPELRDFQAEAAERAPTRLDRPAPSHFAEAIDATEYDLVALQQALYSSGSESTGAMRYLLSANENLARSLRTRYSRWHERKWTPADGFYDVAEGTLAALARHRTAARAYSPTALQHYAACPYRFLLHGIIGLRPRQSPEPLHQMDPLTRGAIFHAVQRELYRELIRGKHLPLTSGNLAQVQSIADVVLDGVAEEFQEDLSPAIPRVWHSEIEDLRTDLHGWLTHLSATDGWMPVHTELAFGMRPDEESDAASSDEAAVLPGGARLRGRIDLVEKHLSRMTLRVTDHKTGKAPQQRQLRLAGGTILQPVLYALALEQVLGEPVEGGRLFFCTQRGNYESREVALNEQTRADAERALAIVDSAVETGRFPAAPARGVCEICDYRSVCGPNEQQRCVRKPSVQELDEMRCMQ